MDITLPKIIKENCIEFEWKNKKIWQLHLPIEKMKISRLAWQFKIPFWSIGNKKYGLTPNEFMKNPKNYPSHYKRISNLDLQHPIDIIKNKKNKWEILDGLHRLVKAKMMGKKEVKVRKIPQSKVKEILR
jgi:hypothetical protein